MAIKTFVSGQADVNVTSVMFRYEDDMVVVNSLQSNQICNATASWATSLSTGRNIVGGHAMPSLLNAFRSVFGTVSLITLNVANAAPLDDEKKKRLANVMNRVLKSLADNLDALPRDTVGDIPGLSVESCEGMCWGVRVSNYVDNQLRVDLFVDAQGGSNEEYSFAPDVIARASDAFRPVANAKAIVETDSEVWAELTTEQLDALIKTLNEAKTIRAKKNMLGKRDGRSSKEAFFKRVNQKLASYAGTRPSTEEKKELVRLIHEAQELGADLIYDGGVVCRIALAKRGDASTYFFQVRKAEGRKTLVSGAKVPSNLEIRRKTLDRKVPYGTIGPSAHPA